MFISDKSGNKKIIHIVFCYLLISIFCALFGAIYELFAHQVYSYFMIYAFAFPMLGGAIPFLVLAWNGSWRMPGIVSRQLYHSGIAALTVGSILQGVLDIYGTTNHLILAYWYAGGALCLAGVLLYVIGRKIST